MGRILHRSLQDARGRVLPLPRGRRAHAVTAPAAPAEVIRLADAGTASLVGAKASRLGLLMKAGLPVPEGVVLPPATVARVAAGEPLAVRALVEALPAAPHGLAVRSSSCDEDGTVASHAGIFETRLSVPPEEVPAAAAEVLASARLPHVATYRTRFGLPPSAHIAVVVQRMVVPQMAGVLFTRHPVTWASGTVIEVVHGLGDALAAGDVLPEDGRALSDGQRKALLDLACRCERACGPGLDIEWAMEDGELFLLQARPITGDRRP